MNAKITKTMNFLILRNNFYRILRIGILILTVLITGCESENVDELDGGAGNGSGGSGGSGGNFNGYWQRGDGLSAYLEFENSTVRSCANGEVKVGTFNSSEPSMTFVIGSDPIKFPLQFSSNQLLVGVPNQAVNTNNATLYYPSDNFPCDGGSGGSGGSGGGSSTGNAMFWTSSDLGCGSISVNLSTSSATISQFYSSGTPECGASGCANFTLEPGTYNFTASCSSKNWSGSINITANGCARLRLTD